MMSKKVYHAWFSNEMYAFTGTIYTWKNADNALIRTTIVSDSSSSPMLNSERSRYKDFKYMGPVIEWMRTDPLPIWGMPTTNTIFYEKYNDIEPLTNDTSPPEHKKKYYDNYEYRDAIDLVDIMD
jgi:hypothetical protein